VLLANELNQCKGKWVEIVDINIKILQKTYQEIYQDILQPMVLDKEKALSKIKKYFYTNPIIYSHWNQVKQYPQIPRCYKNKLIIWKKHWRCYNYLSKPCYSYLQFTIKLSKPIEKKTKLIKMTQHINSYNKNIIQTPVIERYSSKYILEAHRINHSL